MLLLRWILRARSRHCTRVVVLCDSSVWTGAASKVGSSTALNRVLRLAGDILVEIVLVPSAENPADVPSRGVRAKRSSRRRDKFVAPGCHRKGSAKLRSLPRILPFPVTSCSSLSGGASTQSLTLS